MEHTYDRDELEIAEATRVVLHNNVLSLLGRLLGFKPHDRHEASDIAFRIAREE